MLQRKSNCVMCGIEFSEKEPRRFDPGVKRKRASMKRDAATLPTLWATLGEPSLYINWCIPCFKVGNDDMSYKTMKLLRLRQKKQLDKTRKL